MGKYKSRNNVNQQGMVALMIVFIMTIVITLIVVGLGKLTLRNQKQTQESQLSTQAFYAAETGIQDAIEFLRNGGNKDTSTYNCDPATSTNLGTVAADVKNISGDGQVEYTCQDIKLQLSDLTNTAKYDYSTRDILRAYNSAGGYDTFDSIEIYWHRLALSADGGDGTTIAGLRDATNFARLPMASTTGTDAWNVNAPALLRANLVYVPDINSSAGIETRTWYMVPMVNANRTINWTTTSNNDLVGADCDGSSATPAGYGGYACKAVISGKTFASSGLVLLRLRSMYKQQSNVKIIVKNAGVPKFLTNATSGIAQIDVTGRAANVYRRLRVQVQYAGTNSLVSLPEYVLESATDLCKRTQVAMQYTDIYNISSPLIVQSPNSTAVTDPVCGL